MNKQKKKYSIPSIKFDITPDLKNINPLYVEVENYHPEKFVKVEMLAPIKL